MKTFNLNSRIALVASVGLALAGSLPLHANQMDNRIEASAKSSYNFKTYLRGEDIRVDSDDGVVTLSGTVAREYHKYLAENTVCVLPGVKSVKNNLTLADQPTEKSDGWITMKVKGALTFHKNVRATDTEVHTTNGIVTLSGTADNEAQKQLTREYARDVEGVLEVRNELVVAQPERVARHRSLGQKIDDGSITAQIKTALVLHKSTHPVDTTVHTKNGVVTLSGEANNAAEKELVAKLAEDIDGVKHVKNHMSVRK